MNRLELVGFLRIHVHFETTLCAYNVQHLYFALRCHGITDYLFVFGAANYYSHFCVADVSRFEY
jgi:hypothetical protein